tara:strand:+ start:972 stop:1349 length:378 start_codon:yes stop_codon:yes gene_type:complete
VADRLSTISNPNGTLRFIETAANATRNAGILGSSYIIKYVKLDNSLNTTEAVYLKIWLDGTPPTVGTTTPDMIFKAPAGGVVEYLIPDGIQNNSNAVINVAVVTTGGTGGTTNPTGTVSYVIIGQ